MKKITLIIFLLCAYFTNAQGKNDSYTIKNIESNSIYQDYGATFYGDSIIVFTSSRKVNTILDNIWKDNGLPYLRPYQGVLDSVGEIIDVEQFAKGINTKFHDANLRFTKDLKTVYYTSNNYLNRKFKKDSLGRNLNQLYKASLQENGKWGDVVAMPFNSNDYQTGHPTLNADETKLYFISDMPGGYGLTDIYVVDILENGTYGTPINLGPNVNTAGKEMFPNMSDGTILYFASDGHSGGHGGLDIYATNIVDNKGEIASNLGTPINSPSDDFALLYQEGKNTGYFASNRPGGKGDDDIYYFEKLTQMVSGTVTDEVTGDPIVDAEVILYDDSDAEVAKMTVEGEDATYSFDVESNKFYKLTAIKPKYESDSEGILLEAGKDAIVLLELKKEEVKIVREKVVIVIDPIYFDFDSADITPDAAIELDKVVEIMNKYPLVKVESGSHTDRRGPAEYNIILSDRRAKSTVDYLISKGISEERLTWKGYGETELINKCDSGVPCTEEDHDVNRRTEFVILNPDVLYVDKVIKN